MPSRHHRPGVGEEGGSVLSRQCLRGAPSLHSRRRSSCRTVCDVCVCVCARSCNGADLPAHRRSRTRTVPCSTTTVALDERCVLGTRSCTYPGLCISLARTRKALSQFGSEASAAHAFPAASKAHCRPGPSGLAPFGQQAAAHCRLRPRPDWDDGKHTGQQSIKHLLKSM
jgi:hypothetical protein